MKMRVALFLLVVSLLPAAALAQTAEEIIAKNTSARGGTDKLAAIHSLREITAEEANWGGRGLSVLSIMRPDRMSYYYEWRGTPRAKPLTVIWAFDGNSGWYADQRKGLQTPNPVTGEELEAFKGIAGNQFAASLGEFQANGNTVELVGQDAPASGYKIRFKNSAGIHYAYYDPQSFLIVRYEVEAYRKNKNQILFVIEVSDYRNVDGILFPYHFKIDSVDTSAFAAAEGLPLPFAFVGAKKNSMISTIQSIEVNSDMNDSTFRVPAGTNEPAKR